MELFARLQENLNNSGIVVPLEEVQNCEKLKARLRSGPGSDWYTSLFYYPSDILDLYNKKGSVAGYTGPAYSKCLIWDFDSKEDITLAKNDVRTLLTRLKDNTKLTGSELLKHVSVYFSGNKGFHVNLKISKELLPEQVSLVCGELATGLKTYDSVIYNTTRLIRVVNTKHAVSGLYKIIIDPTILAKDDAINTIKVLAKTPGSWVDSTIPLENLEFIEVILNKKVEKKSIIIENIEEIDGIRGVNLLDFKKSKNMPKCIYALSQGIMIPGLGQRNHIFLHLGNYYRNQGHNKEVVHNILKGIARLNKQLYPEFEEFDKEEIWNSIIKRVFSDENALNIGGWGVKPEDEIFIRYCKSLPSDCKCPIHNASLKKEIVQVEDIAKDFDFFATNFSKNIVTTGIKFLDDNLKICTGTTTLLIGSAGVGKTSSCLNILEHTNKENHSSVFFSLDMGKNLLYLKLAQRLTGWKQEDIFKAFKDNDRKLISYLKDQIKQHYGNTYFDFSGMLSLDDMIQRISIIEQENSTKVKVVVVDYASRIKGPYSDTNSNEAFNALASKDAADKTNSAWIILNQISRASGDGATPLRTKRIAKGSSAWEESASGIITMWRSFLGLDNVVDPESGVTFYDRYMNIAIVKNRLGSECEDVLLWQGDRGLLFDMSKEEKELYDTEERKKIKLASAYRYQNK